MRKITDIYDEYKIIKNLREHQMRVAAVAMQIGESMDIIVGTENIVKACLVHDLGNIIKADLSYFPEFLEPEGYDYWKKVQDEFKEKYGENEHEATLHIVIQIGMGVVIRDIVSLIGYPYVEMAANTKDFNIKIATYADFRVGPYGVLTVEERAEEGRKRYEGKKNDVTDEERILKQKYIKELENQIFAHLNFKPEDINDDSIAPYIEKVKNFEL